MEDPVAAAYAAHPYPEFLHDFAHPARIFAMAGLYGLPRDNLDGLRVLELGCNRGTTLNWIARTVPGATCLGVDLDPAAIAEATRQAADLKNIAYRQADIAALDLGAQKFDYILVHGIFSWVADPVRDAILSLAARHLAPGGIAMISWNAHPGSLFRGAIRELMLLEAGHGRSATRALERLTRGLAGNDLPHARHLSQAVAMIEGQNPEVRRHDEAGPEMEPFYLLQIADWAAGHGLSYLADAELALDWPVTAPEGVRAALDDLPRLEALQYLDFFYGTAFRRSLFVGQGDGAMQLAMPDAAHASALHAASDISISGEKMAFRHRPGTFALPDDAKARHLLERLASWRAGPVPALLETLNGDQTEAGILRLAAQGIVTLSLGPLPDD